MAKSVNDFIIDFSKSEDSGGGGIRVKPGTYKVKIIAAKTGTSQNKNTPYLELKLKFLEGQPAKQKKVLTEHLYVSPKAFSRFRKLLEALDIKQPAKLNLVKLIPKLKGGEMYVVVDDEPPREGYDKPRSRVEFEGFINPDDYDPDADEDEEEDEEDEDLEDEDEDEEEEDEEEDEDEEEEEEPPKRKRASSKAKSKSSSKRKAAEDDEDDEDDEDEDEEPASKKRSKSKAKKSSKKSKKKADDDDDEDEDLDDLDLDEM